MAAEHVAPECEHRMHDICHGTYTVYVSPWTLPTVSGRCDCPCHTGATATGGALETDTAPR